MNEEIKKVYMRLLSSKGNITMEVPIAMIYYSWEVPYITKYASQHAKQYLVEATNRCRDSEMNIHVSAVYKKLLSKDTPTRTAHHMVLAQGTAHKFINYYASAHVDQI